MHNKELQNQIDFLLSVALHKCDSEDDARDLTQETILAALLYCEKGGIIEDMRGWLLTVLNRKYYDLLRKKYQLSTVSIGEEFDIADTDDIAGDVIRAEEREAVRREVAYLADSYRSILVRHYFYGESVADIASSLHIPVGTLKSRLDFGRKQMKKGLETMETYTENSYMPHSLHVRNSGRIGLNDEPMSLTEDHILEQNLLILAYEKPIHVNELARAIGVATAYVEPVVRKLVDGELMKRMGDGKVYTDFIIYHATDYVKYIKEQEAFATEYAELYCTPMQKAIDALKQTDFYSRRLERYLLINIAERVLWDGLQHAREPQVFPDRPNGGKWIAFGTIYPPNYTIPPEKRGKEEYAMAGERRSSLPKYLDGTDLRMYDYETSLYPYPKHYGYGYQSLHDTADAVIKLFYLIHKGISPEAVGLDNKIIKAIPNLEQCGFLSTASGKPELLVPCLTHTQAKQFSEIIKEAVSEAAAGLEEPLTAYIRTHKKEIPPHLKSVPDQKRTMPYEPSTMMLVYEAIARGLHPRDLGYPCPETYLVFD